MKFFRPHRFFLVLTTLLLSLALLPPATYAASLDYDLAGHSGHFYGQANGHGGDGATGFTITNADGIPFWDSYQHLGGPDVLGYPVTQRFVWDGYTVQAMQKVVLQWRPDTKTMAFVNVLDRMHDLGLDGWLAAFRQTPAPFDTSPDTGLAWSAVVGRHDTLLDASPAIKARYWSDPSPVDHFGLPMSWADEGNSIVVRAQRAVFQYWKSDVPWARAGEVTIANAGDLAKESSVFPAVAVTPMLPPDTAPPAPLKCPSLPLRGFGVAWSNHSETYDLLGCPAYPDREESVPTMVQRFEHGWMLEVGSATPASSPPPVVTILFDDNAGYVDYPDTWVAGKDPVSTGLTPPVGLLEPQSNFGKVWREGTGARTRERLGWATEVAKSGFGAVQLFYRGRMVWTPDPRMIFVLAHNSPSGGALDAWRAYPDTYSG